MKIDQFEEDFFNEYRVIFKYFCNLKKIYLNKIDIEKIMFYSLEAYIA